MLIKVGSVYNASITITNQINERVVDDCVVVTIKDRINNQFFNGIAWVDAKCELSAKHVTNGVYIYKFTPSHSSVFDITIKSEKYQITKTDTVESYVYGSVKYIWNTNEPFVFSKDIQDDVVTNYSVSIFRELDKAYYDGNEWLADTPSCRVPIEIIEDSVLQVTSLLDIESDYILSVFKNGTKIDSIIIEVKENAEIKTPVKITNLNFSSQNGTDSTVVSQLGNPLAGVKITCYDALTKEVVGTTATLPDGSWSLTITQGKYFFTFEKDGYISVSFERTVR